MSGFSIHAISPSVRAIAIGSLPPDSASSVRATRRLMCVKRSVANTAAASVDATTAPEQNRLEPREVEEHARGDTGEERGDQDADRAQQRRRRRDAPQPPPRGLQPSLEQDQDEADDADLARELRVVELDPARAVRAEQHPQRQEGDENGHTGARCAECEQDAHTEHGPDDEEGDTFVHTGILAAPLRGWVDP